MLADYIARDGVLNNAITTNAYSDLKVLTFLGDITTKTKKIIIDDEETRKTKADRIKEFNIEIFDDKDIDFTKVDEAEKILNKYKNQQISRRNYDPD